MTHNEKVVFMCRVTMTANVQGLALLAYLKIVRQQLKPNIFLKVKVKN